MWRRATSTNCGSCRAAQTATTWPRAKNARPAIPTERPVGFSPDMAQDAAALQRWRAYLASLDLPETEFGVVLEDIWPLLSASCARLVGAAVE